MKNKPRREMIGMEGMVLLDTIRRLNRRNAVDHLRKLILKTHPADLAWVFRHLVPEERQAVFSIVAQTDLVADFLSELDRAILLELAKDMTPQFLVSVIAEMASDDAADLLEALPDDMAEDVRRLMQSDDRAEMDELLQYDPQTAGGIMSPDFMALDEELTVGDAIERIQQRSEEKEMSFYLYITHGEEGKLSGVLSLRELLMHPPYRKLKNIMNPKVVAVTTDTDQEEVAHIVSQYDFLAVPVVDASYKLVGIVTVDDIIDVIREEATEDFLQMAGAGKDREILLKPVVQNAFTRAPWLFATWIGGITASLIIGFFQEEMQKALALAAFIPIVTGMAGNIATQSSTIVVRGIATGRVNMQAIGQVIWKEMRVGFLLGAFFGLILAVVAYVRYPDLLLLAPTVGLTIFVNMTNAATVGTVVPLVLRRLDIDTAVATGPFVTTSLDVMGVTIYLSLAKLILGL